MQKNHLKTAATLLTGALTLSLTGCGASEASAKNHLDTLTIDWATYNPLSLVVKDQRYLEKDLTGTKVRWVQSAGSNKANEALRSGAIQVGSTAGSAALLARANGSPIKAIDIYSQPEWSALVVAKGSKITSVKDLKGKKVAATKGTDPYFFLLQALKANGLSDQDVTVENLQHADGATALENGSVDAWAGLDPIMAQAQTKGARLIYRNIAFNTYGFLDATEDFLKNDPAIAQDVVDAYEKARVWAAQHPDELVKLLAKAAGIDPAVAKTVLAQRTKLDVDPVPGSAQLKVLETVGPAFVKTGDVQSQDQIDDAVGSLLDPSLAKKAVTGAGK